MEIKLNEEENKKLTYSVIVELKKYYLENSITDEIYNDVKVLTKRLIQIHEPDIEAKINSIELLTPVVEKILQKDNLLVNIVNRNIREYFSTKEFKKISIKYLEDRIRAIEEELEEERN